MPEIEAVVSDFGGVLTTSPRQAQLATAYLGGDPRGKQARRRCQFGQHHGPRGLGPAGASRAAVPAAAPAAKKSRAAEAAAAPRPGKILSTQSLDNTTIQVRLKQRLNRPLENLAMYRIPGTDRRPGDARQGRHQRDPEDLAAD